MNPPDFETNIAPDPDRERSFLWEGVITQDGEGYAWDFTLPDEAAAQRVFPLDVTETNNYLSIWIGSKHPLDIPAMVERSNAALRSGDAVYSQEYRCFNRFGEEQWLREEVHIESTGPGCWKAQGICTDVTERHRMESALNQSEAYFRRLFDRSLDAIFVHDAEGRVLDVNRKAVESLGYTREELLGMNVMDYDLQVDPEKFNALNAHLLAGGEATVQGVQQRKDGTTFPVEIQLGLLEGGESPKVLACARDVSERWRVEDALRESEQTLRGFFDTPHFMLGIAEAHRDDLFIVEGNEATCRFSNLEANALHHRWSSELGTPPDVLQIWIDRCRECEAKGEAVNFEYERVTPSGSNWLWVSLSPIGKGTSRFAYVVQDVTERKRAEADLKASEAQFREAMIHAPIGKALVSLDGYFMTVNPALSEIVGYTEDEFRQLTFQEITHPDDLETDLAYVESLLKGSIKRYQMEKRYFHKEGHEVPIQLSVSLVRSEDGRPLYFIAQIQDITQQKHQEGELKRLNEELYRTARQDHLTGLRNRLQLQEDLETMQARSARYGHSYCVAMCDIDLFKAHNDLYGHLAGDRTLKLVAEAIRSMCRAGDLAYRYGGEEFLIIFPEQTVETAGVAIERIRKAVEALAIPQAGNPHGEVVTISAGVASMTAGEEKTIDRLLLEADAALYHSKQSGRNRITSFES